MIITRVRCKESIVKWKIKREKEYRRRRRRLEKRGVKIFLKIAKSNLHSRPVRNTINNSTLPSSPSSIWSDLSRLFSGVSRHTSYTVRPYVTKYKKKTVLKFERALYIRVCTYIVFSKFINRAMNLFRERDRRQNVDTFGVGILTCVMRLCYRYVSLRDTTCKYKWIRFDGLQITKYDRGGVIVDAIRNVVRSRTVRTRISRHVVVVVSGRFRR